MGDGGNELLFKTIFKSNCYLSFTKISSLSVYVWTLVKKRNKNDHRFTYEVPWWQTKLFKNMQQLHILQKHLMWLFNLLMWGVRSPKHLLEKEIKQSSLWIFFFQRWQQVYFLCISRYSIPETFPFRPELIPKQELFNVLIEGKTNKTDWSTILKSLGSLFFFSPDFSCVYFSKWSMINPKGHNNIG